MNFLTGGMGHVPEEILKIYPKINVTGIKQFNVSPAYYESCQILKEIEPTKAMNLGTILHYCILEPDKFEMMFCDSPKEIPLDVVSTVDDLKEWCKREGVKTSGTKAELISRLRDHGTKFRTYDEFMEEYSKGKTVLSDKDLKAAKRIIERVKSIKSIDQILKGGQVEQLAWVLVDLGAEDKVIVTLRIDYFKQLEKPIAGFECFAIDLKTTNTLCNERDFKRFIANDDSEIQMSFYSRALEYLTGKKTAAGILMVETSAPFTVSLKVMDEASLMCGEAQIFKNLNTFLDCHKKNAYPTGMEEIKEISLPEWKLSQIEYEQSKEL